MNIVITGGAGYIGCSVVELLLNLGHNVTVIDPLWFNNEIPSFYRYRKNYKFIRGSICDSELLDAVIEDSVDYIIHTAAVVGEPAGKKFPELTYKTNYEASIELIKRIQNTAVNGLIFLSTCSNYGVSEGLATEESPLKPLSLYAETKVDVERYLMDNAKGLNWVICRLSTVYGVSPRMRFDLTVNDFTMNALIKKYLDIFLPYTSRPYIHVSDVAKVLVRVIDKFELVKNNVVNVGFNGENYQKIHITNVIKKFIPDVRTKIINKGMDLRDYQVDFSKLNKYLGMKNTYTLEDGVSEIINVLKTGKINNPEDQMYYNTSPRLGVIN